MAYVDPDQLKEAFEQLFRDFRDIEGEFKYVNKINRMIRDDQRSLVIDYQDLILMDDIYDSSDLSDTLLQEPRMMIQTGGQVLADFVKAENPEFFSMYRNEKFFVRFNNIPRKIKIRDIRANDVDEIYWLEGIIIRTTEIKSIIETAVFECDDNGHEIILEFEDGVYSKPQRCSEDTCSSKKFHINQKASKMVDWQFITLQEKPEDLPPGASPKSIPCQLTEDIVNAVRPGDRVNLGGIIRSRPSKTIKSGQLLTFDNWIEVNFVESSTKEDELTEITPDEEQEFLEMARDHHIFDHLLNSIAPQIHGLEEVKKAALLMLFGGVDKTYPDGFSTRGQPNVLLVGDPGVAKSQLLRYVQSIAPRGLFTSGKGSSAAGLTAAIIRDPETGEITLEAGAMVLADRGVCLAEDTEILTTNGELVKIRDIVDNNLKSKVLSFNPENFDVEKDEIVATSARFSHEVYNLEFSTGDKITASKEHPLPTWNNGIIWKTVEQIQEGDVIIDYRDYPFDSNECQCRQEEFKPEFAEFLGLIVTDGNLSKKKYKVSFYSKDEEQIERYLHLVKMLFGIDAATYMDQRNGVSKIYFDNKSMHQMLASIGIPKGNKTKKAITIPHILHETQDVIHSFLTGVVNGDGSISNRIGGGIIDIISGNEETAYFYRKLLRKIGIVSRVHTIEQNGGGIVNKGQYTNYKTSITGINNIQRFDHPNLLSYKRENLEQIVTRRNNSDKIYAVDRLIYKLSAKLPHGTKKYLYNNSIRTSTLESNGVTRTCLSNAVSDLKEVVELQEYPELQLLDQLLKKQVHFIKVSTKSKARDQMVYNIQVKKNQTYFANFIPVHNCLIDEFDKMNENDRSAIHEAMEQHTVSVAKAGIVATLNARTGVLAAANPKYGRYEENRPFNENVNLSPAILSRFDLVFILRDIPEEERDGVLADHILKLHRFHGSADSNRPPMDEEKLKKYIAYAKRNFHPQLSQEAAELLETFYVNMRNSYGAAGDNPKDRVTITARQLEGIIRLSEARARASLKTEVTKNDAQFAIDLMEYSLSEIARDPETGTLDIDALYSGQTQSKRSRLTRLQKVIDFVYKDAGGPFREEELIEAALTEGLSEDYVTGAIRQMVRDGALYQPRRGQLDKP